MVDQFTVNLTAEEVSWILCRVAIGESGQVSRATARTGRDCRRGEFAAGQALQGSQKAVGSRAGSSHRLERRLVLGCLNADFASKHNSCRFLFESVFSRSAIFFVEHTRLFRHTFFSKCPDTAQFFKIVLKFVKFQKRQYMLQNVVEI